jgi:hypothetical protein
MSRARAMLHDLRSRYRLLTAVVAVTGAAAFAALGALALPEPAAARASNCFGDWIWHNWAYGTCKGASNGWGGFSLTVQCEWWGANTVYGFAPQTIYASCPGWSRVTWISVQPAAF